MRSPFQNNIHEEMISVLEKRKLNPYLEDFLYSYWRIEMLDNTKFDHFGSNVFKIMEGDITVIEWIEFNQAVAICKAHNSLVGRAISSLELRVIK